jgi:diacylglycerol O-acyltransferase
MGEEDALLWRLERDPVLRSTTAAVAVLERAPPRDALRATLQRAACAIPRLRQRVLDLPPLLSTPIWVDDPHFDLDYHLRFVRAPGKGTLRELLDLAAPLAMQGFDAARPPWEFVVAEDLEGGRAGVVQKLHHAVTDGAAGMLLMQRVYHRDPDEAGDADSGGLPPAVPALRSAAEVVLGNLAAAPWRTLRRAGVALGAALHPLATARRVVDDGRSVVRSLGPALQPKSPLLRGRSTRYRFEALVVALPALRAAARAVGCRVNDAFLAALAGGFGRYHERHDAAVEELRVTLPINLRSGESATAAGNRIMLARLALPLAAGDAGRRMRAIRDRVAEERRQPALAYVEDVAAVLNRLPPALLGAAASPVTRSVDCVASCVPGLPAPLHLAGARVEALYAFGPTAGAATNVTLLSYGDEAFVTLNADPAAVPDPPLLRSCLEEGFDEVLALARA